MEEFRIKQAQSLLKDASMSKTNEEKLKPPKEGYINVQVFEKSLALYLKLKNLYTQAGHLIN